MFYVLQRTPTKSRLVVLSVHKELCDVFNCHRIDDFSIDNNTSHVRYHRTHWTHLDEPIAVYDYFKVCYNHNGTLLPYTELVGGDRERWWRWYNGPKCWYGPNRRRSKKQGRRARKGWRHRKIRTTHERRWSYAVDREDQELYNVRVRSKRNATSIPNSWDDFYGVGEANWKCYRTTQYKQK